jgi:hypothetical protein
VSAVQRLVRSLRRVYRQDRIAATLERSSADARASGKRVVHMLHVRKTGGTAVKAALENAALPADLRLLVHGHSISLAKIPVSDDVFLFLREPVSRFVSGFEMRRREGRPRHYRAWSPAERRAFERFDSADDLALGLVARDTSTRNAAERAMADIYHVRSHLTDWLVDEAEVRARRDRLIFVGWQERLDVDFAQLVALLGLPATTSLPDDEFVANRASATDRARELSGDGADIIRAWYADDYRLIALLADLGLTVPPDEIVALLDLVRDTPPTVAQMSRASSR